MKLSTSRNLLLRRLSPAEEDRLQPHATLVPLALRHTLYESGMPIEHVYFMEAGITSLVTDLEDGQTIETGTVGYEGVVGLPAILGVPHSSGRAFCQVVGRAWRVAEPAIAAERERHSPWFRVLLRYAYVVHAMAAQSAACNRLHHVDARMSRWLLMTRDRVESDEFALTQEFLAQMLGVARPTVNIAAATLQRAGFITYTRGRVTVLDRGGLESAACECYRRVREEFEMALAVTDPADSGTG